MNSFRTMIQVTKRLIEASAYIISHIEFKKLMASLYLVNLTTV